MDKPLFIANISNESGAIKTTITFESKTFEDATAVVKTIHKALEFLNQCYFENVDLSAPIIRNAFYDLKDNVWTVKDLENHE